MTPKMAGSQPAADLPPPPPDVPTALPPPSATPAPNDHLRAVFDHFDRNKDGHISGDEMTLSLRNLGISIAPADLASLMDDADEDADGFIDYNEFVGLYRALASAGGSVGDAEDADDAKPADQADKELKDAFEVFDTDGDGLITAKELYSVLDNIGVLQGRSLADCAAMIRRVDSDGNGKVDLQEFKEMMASGL